jgi:hypothetical protein
VTLYSDEVWTGIEYAVAGTMLFEGMVDEAIEIVRMARYRHDGRCRSPWNDVECGDHYARAMSSWVLLEAYAGFRWNGREASLSFLPPFDEGEFRTFFITGGSWGTYEQREDETDGRTYCIGVNHGTLNIRRLELPLPGGVSMPEAYLGEEKVNLAGFSTEETLQLELDIEIGEGEILRIKTG